MGFYPTPVSLHNPTLKHLLALENLITTLRTHLSRLTTELSDHQQLLKELRSLRESDAHALALKGQDVDQLRREVERLAGEVEVLRGVVEEGLKERRNVRALPEDHEEHIAYANSVHEHSDDQEESRQPHEQADSSDSEDGAESSMASQDHSPSPSPRPLSRLADRTIRTDHPTIGSSHLTHGDSLEPFVNEEELERITAEVEERRSERSHSASSDSPQSSAGSPSRTVSRAASPDVSLGFSAKASAPTKISQISRASSPASSGRIHMGVPARPGAPTPGRALQSGSRSNPGQRKVSSQSAQPEKLETPFPQIRGARLERLFFAAPEHNVNTCSVCHRRRRREPHSDDEQQARDWLRRRSDALHRATVTIDARNGPQESARHTANTDFPKNPPHNGTNDGASSDPRLPPQTVLARVLRELEDDFTHYKRFVNAILSDMMFRN